MDGYINRNEATNIDMDNDLYNIRKDITRWLRTLDTKYHLTITFTRYFNEILSEKYTNLLLRMVGHEFIGDRLNNDFINGVVIREKQKSGSIHYHILICNHNAFKYKRNKNKSFKGVIVDKCNRIVEKFVNKDGNSMNFHPIDPNKGWLLQEYYKGNLEEYLTKSLEKDRLNFNFLTPLSADGFSFLDKQHEDNFGKRLSHWVKHD